MPLILKLKNELLLELHLLTVWLIVCYRVCKPLACVRCTTESFLHFQSVFIPATYPIGEYGCTRLLIVNPLCTFMNSIQFWVILTECSVVFPYFDFVHPWLVAVSNHNCDLETQKEREVSHNHLPCLYIYMHFIYLTYLDYPFSCCIPQKHIA